MKPPPVILFVYARPTHTARVLEGLRRTGAPFLRIFSDAPKTPEKAAAVEQVRRLVRAIDWARVELTERAENVGLSQSIVSGIGEVLENHEAVIILEDDCVPGPSFYTFMCAALEHYASETGVASVSGYGLPMDVPENYPFDGFFTARISSWGWGTWRRAWKRAMRHDVAKAWDEAAENHLDLTAGGNDIPDIIRAAMGGTGRRDIWTPLWVLGTMVEGMRTLWPTGSHIQNIGIDGSGENCAVDSRFETELSERTGDFRFPPTGRTDLGMVYEFQRRLDSHERPLEPLPRPRASLSTVDRVSYPMLVRLITPLGPAVRDVVDSVLLRTADHAPSLGCGFCFPNPDPGSAQLGFTRADGEDEATTHLAAEHFSQLGEGTPVLARCLATNAAALTRSLAIFEKHGLTPAASIPIPALPTAVLEQYRRSLLLDRSPRIPGRLLRKILNRTLRGIACVAEYTCRRFSLFGAGHIVLALIREGNSSTHASMSEQKGKGEAGGN